MSRRKEVALDHPIQPPSRSFPPEVFGGVAGAFFGLLLVKFGNPGILDRLVTAPTTLLEFLFQPWPAAWSFIALGLVLLAALPVARWRLPPPRGFLLLPLAWLAWQLVSATSTTEPRLTRIALLQFAGGVACFHLGLLALSQVRRLNGFWIGVLVGFSFMAWMGIDQHYGGLEATRRLLYEQGNMDKLPPEFVRRLETGRVFATLLYPNALAGVLLLLLPALGVVTWQMTRQRSPLLQLLLTGMVAWAGLACLVWSGSKAGWLIALVLGLVVVTWLPVTQRLRYGLVVLVVAGGLVAFGLKFAGYFMKGATSASARLDYWRAGGRTFLAHPWLGSGPGTFAEAYRRIKPPGAEMAQLAHNDYLQQASDSGLPGALLYTTFVIGSVVLLRRRAWEEPTRFAVWLGLLGWALQSCVEFGLYLPAIGWTAFCLLGWLWGTDEPVANAPRPGPAAPPETGKFPRNRLAEEVSSR